jgi:hypothetical protein
MQTCELTLTSAETAIVAEVIRSAIGAIDCPNSDDSLLLRILPSVFDSMPRCITIFLREFRALSRDDIAIIHGLPSGEMAQSYSTPLSHKSSVNQVHQPWDLMHAALASALGDPFSYAGQQGGRLLNDIVPIAHFANVANASAGWLHDFDFHTEDAFHWFRPDYICLMSIRNTECVGTTVAAIRDVTLTDDVRNQLSTPQFTLPPNALHKSDYHTVDKIAILDGSGDNVTLRVNSHAPQDNLSSEGKEAFLTLVRLLGEAAVNLLVFSLADIFA